MSENNNSDDNKSNHSNQTNYSTTTETTTNTNNPIIHDDTYYYNCIPSSSSLSLSTTTTQFNTTPIQSIHHNTLLLSSLDTWDGEKSLHYWFSIVLIQGVLQLPLCDLKEYTLVCKSISKLVRDYIQRNFWFPQHSNYLSEPNLEKRYLWYSPCHFKKVKNVSTLPINTTKIRFFPTFDSLLTFPITLQQVTHIEFGVMFNQRIGCGIKSEINNLPLTLTHLELSSYFNQSVDDLPPNLTFLSLGFHFNQSVDNLPPNLTNLWFEWHFNHTVDHLPPKLTHLRFSELFNQPLNKLPLSLTHLTLINFYGVRFNQPLSQLQSHFESNLEYLVLSLLLVQRYESSIPPNFMELESEKYKSHIVYKRQKTTTTK